MPEETDPATPETPPPAKKGASVGTGFAGETTGSNFRAVATPSGEEATVLMGADAVGSQIIGDYEVLGRLGQGGMGAVYRARQISLDRQVALKLLPATLEADPEFVTRFQREARVAANLNHANLVKVYSSGKADGSHFIAMELVEGETLGQWLKRGALPPPEALRICADVARALEHGWNRAQLIHRDIKPGNIFLSTRGEVKVGDLGLAKSLSGDTTGLTQTGTAMGTPHYISPEQARGDKELDFRADIYSLGCTLFQMLTGRTPYEGRDPVAVFHQHIHAPVPAILKVLPSCPIPLARLVGKMLKKSKHERQSSYGELLAQIESVQALFAPAASALESTFAPDLDATVLQTPSPANPRPATGATQVPSAPKSKLPFYCGIAALVLAIALGGVFFLLPRTEKLTKAQLYALERAAKGAASIPLDGSTAPPARAHAATVHTFAGHRYQFFPDTISWMEAKAKAEAAGGYLATITSGQEFDWVEGTFYSAFGGNEYSTFWIGGNASTSATWQWISGEPVEWRFSNGRPDTKPDEYPAYLSMQQQRGRMVFNDSAPASNWREYSRGYLVEWDTAGNTNAAGSRKAPVLQAASAPTAAEPWQDVLRDPAKLKLAGGPEVTRTPAGVRFGLGGGSARVLPGHAPSRDGAIRVRTLFGGLQPKLSVRSSEAGNYLFYLAGGKELIMERSDPTAKGWIRLQRVELPQPVPMGQQYELELRAVGQTLTGKFDGAIVATVSDATFPEGEFGINIVGNMQRAPLLLDFLQVLNLDGAGGASPAPILPSAEPSASPTTTASPATAAHELLKLTDVKSDAVAGTWAKTAAGLVLQQPEGFGVCALPYEPPEEYDFEAEFTPDSGTTNPNFYLRAGGSSFAWKLNAHQRKPPIYGLDLVDGLKMPQRTDGVVTHPLEIQNGRRYTSRFEVRRSGLRGVVDGVELFRWSGDYKRLSLEPGAKMPNERAIGIGSYKRGVTFHRVTVWEISSPGKVTVPGASAPSASASAAAEPWQDVLRDPAALGLSGAVTQEPEGLRFTGLGSAHRRPTDAPNSDGAIRVRAVFGGVRVQLRARLEDKTGKWAVDSNEPSGAYYLGTKGNHSLVLGLSDNRTQRSEDLRVMPLPARLKDGEEYSLELRAVGSTLTAKFNGAVLGAVTDARFPKGRFGMGVGSVGNEPEKSTLVKAVEVLDLDAPSRASVPPAATPVIVTASAGAAASASAKSPAAAIKDTPFVNSLGMKFVPVPITGGPTDGKRVLFSIWETRVQDYEVFAKETQREWPKRNFVQEGPTHPAVNVNWEDATAFCAWLTDRDRRANSIGPAERFRLPTDHEWSCAVGIAEREDPGKLPVQKSQNITDVFPWGEAWPPPENSGNYCSEELQQLLVAGKYRHLKSELPDYRDGFAETAPVGSYPANRFGLYDLGGNASEWCEDRFDGKSEPLVLRGAAWGYNSRHSLLSGKRSPDRPTLRYDQYGFRVVLAPIENKR
jgi:serine/threonine protein kinase